MPSLRPIVPCLWFDSQAEEAAQFYAGLAKDEAGDADPWLEIHNMGPGPVTLTDFYLSDDPAGPLAYALPDVTLAPGGFYLVWCDNDPDEGELHAPFRLDAEFFREGPELAVFHLREHRDRRPGLRPPAG